MKSIWIINHYATKPDEPATRSFDIGKALAKKGFKITVFSSAFSHYKLETKYLKQHENFKEENFEGINFFWLRSFAYKNNGWQRLLNMLSFSWRVFWIARKINEKPDVIIASSPHIFAGISGYLLARIKGARFFFEVRDLWPQTLVDIGFLKANNPLVWILRQVEKFLYKKAEYILTALPYTAEYVSSLGITEKKIIWIPNGLNMKRYENIKEYQGECNVFMYTGIHARYSNLDVVLKAAEIVGSKAKFILVGDGAEKENLKNMTREMKLSNVEFRDMVPKSEVYKVLSEADVFISIIRDMPILKYGMSSNKLNDYLASGRPIIFCVKAKNNPVEDAKAGLTIEPGNPEALANACNQLISLSREERIKMGKNGIEYASKNLDIEVIAEKLEKLL